MPIATLTCPAGLAVEAVPLTPAGFEPFGTVISSREQLQTMPHIPANYGTATKLARVSAFANDFARAPSQIPATTNWNLFRSSYPAKLITNTGAGRQVYLSRVLERHPYSTQTFLPLGCAAEDISYLVIVAAKRAADGLPDLGSLQAFVARGDQAVTYGAGTWHAPMVSLKQVIDFAVLINENGVADEDCQEVYIEPHVAIEFGTRPTLSKL